MSYITAERQYNNVLVWERTEEGRKLITYPGEYYCYYESPTGQYKSLDGKKLDRMEFEKSSDLYQKREEFKNRGVPLFESDIPVELKILSKYYYGKPTPKLNISFYDIEVDYDVSVGFASIANPYAPVNAVAIYHRWLNQFVVLVVPPTPDHIMPHDQVIGELNKIAPMPTDVEIKIHWCKNERDLLLLFLTEIEDADAISGWNNNLFDTPYVCKRIERVLGKHHLKRMSFPQGELPKYREFESFGTTQLTVDLSGRLDMDYMVLFKKYEAAGRPSYKLESIAEEILPDLHKLEYEGSLAALYRNNFIHFLRYNIRDTEILKGFEDKLGYAELSNEMFHSATGVFKNVVGTLRLADLSIINYCHYKLGVQVNDGPAYGDEEDTGKIQGAYVLEPKVGLHDWISNVDVKSLYPNSIRSINISPETMIGQFAGDVGDWEEIKNKTNNPIILTYITGEVEQYTAKEWRKILWDNKWAVSGYGTVFSQHFIGVIPSILSEWYIQRIKYQELKYGYEVKAKQTNDPHDFMMAAYYDRLQYIFKIKLNSLYGALTNKHFRFSNLALGQSTTGTGRGILVHQCATINKLLTGEYDSFGERIVYGDTDSCYFSVFSKEELASISKAPFDEIKKVAVEYADELAADVNASFQAFMQDAFLCQPTFDDLITCEREIVSSRGIFVEKKRYILHVVNVEGKDVDKLKIMGLDIKKTILPKAVQKTLVSFMKNFLKGQSWDDLAKNIVAYKEQIRASEDFFGLWGLPKGVKNVEEYTQKYAITGKNTRLPGHVAASIYYNQQLKEHNDTASMPIVSNMKIKVFYLKQQRGKFKSIAIPTDIEVVPEWFINEIVPEINIDAHIDRLVNKPLENIFKAIGEKTPTKQSLFVRSVFEF